MKSEIGKKSLLIYIAAAFIECILFYSIMWAGFYKKKKSVRFYFMEIAVCILGISAGITAYMIAVYFELPLLEAIHICVARGIKAAGWLRYPIP